MRPLADPTFRRFWLSAGISGVGSWLLVVAIPVHVFTLTGSAAATGLVIAVEAVPALILGPWAGVLLDQWNLTRALWISDLVSAAAVAVLLFADRPSRVWLVYLAVLAENIASTVFRPGSRALLPAVVGTGPELAAANALNAFSGSVIRLVAPPLGALLLAGPGIKVVLAIDIASYLVSAALIASLRVVVGTRSNGGGLRAGLRAVGRSRVLRGMLTGNSIFLTANAGLTALLVPLTVQRLGLPGGSVGYLISGLGIGFLTGAAISTKAQRWLGIRDLLAAAQVATGLGFFGLVNAPGLLAGIGATVLIGATGSILLITTETTIQRVAPEGTLGRVGALFFAIDSATVVAGALLAPLLVAVAGLATGLNLLAALALLAAPVTLVALPSHPAEFSRQR